jgi:DNA mismatch endonuclease (patch repair protein)
MRSNRRTDTRPELTLRSLLHRAGLRFRKDYRVDLAARRVRVDIAFPRQRLAIFIDGCFWHRCPEHATDPVINGGFWSQKLSRNVERDRQVDAALRGAGWTVLRFWEHEDPLRSAQTINAALRAGGLAA